MQLAFMAWAASCVALAVAVGPALTTRRGHFGARILLLAGAALVVAGIGGMRHGIALMVGIPGVPVAALLITSGLERTPAGAPPGLRLLAYATWVTLGVLGGSLMGAVPRAGGFSPDVWAGWVNVVVFACLAWQLALAIHLMRRSEAGAAPLSGV